MSNYLLLLLLILTMWTEREGFKMVFTVERVARDWGTDESWWSSSLFCQELASGGGAPAKVERLFRFFFLYLSLGVCRRVPVPSFFYSPGCTCDFSSSREDTPWGWMSGRMVSARQTGGMLLTLYFPLWMRLFKSFLCDFRPPARIFFWEIRHAFQDLPTFLPGDGVLMAFHSDR